MCQKRITPNPKSDVLSKALVVGCGITQVSPNGFASLSLLVPLSSVEGKSAADIQKDLGLPWSDKDGVGFWLEEDKVEYTCVSCLSKSDVAIESHNDEDIYIECDCGERCAPSYSQEITELLK